MSDDDYAELAELIKQHYQEKKKEKKDEIMRILWCGRDENDEPWSELHKYRKVIPNEKLPMFYEWEPVKTRKKK
jgi:hypothetical protein